MSHASVRSRRGEAIRRGWFLLLCGVAASACATTAPAVPDDRQSPGPGEGVVVGKFGVPPTREIGAVGRDLHVRRASDGSKWKVPFLEGRSTDGRRTAPFLIALPAGRYEILSWSLRFLEAEEYQEDRDEAIATFDVAAGAVTCIGALYPMRLSPIQRSYAPELLQSTVMLVARDECTPLEALLTERAPALRLPLRVELMTNVGCPSCRADLGPGTGLQALNSTDPDDLGAAIAHGLRVDDRTDFVTKWPSELPARQRSIRVRICVGVDGNVSSVSVLESAHPALDKSVTSTIQTWKYRPYQKNGTPVPFCYRPGFELRPPTQP